MKWVGGLCAALICCPGATAQETLADGVTLFESGNYAKAERIFTPLCEKEETADRAFYYLGRIYYEKQIFDKAAEHFDEAIQHREMAEYYSYYGRALGSRAQKSNFLKQMFLAPKIKGAFEKAVQLDPSHIDGQIGLIRYYTQAPGVAGGSIAKAKEHADAVVRLDPYQGYLEYAAIFQYEEDAAQQEVYLKKAVAADPKKARAYHQLGYLYLRQKRAADAITQFKKMVVCAPRDANSYDSLGDGYLAAAQIDDALQAFKDAVAINPKFSPSVYNLGYCYEMKNMRELAVSQYTEYLKIAPSGNKAGEAKDRIKKLKP